MENNCNRTDLEERKAQLEQRYGDQLPMILTLLGLRKESHKFMIIEQIIPNTLGIKKI